MGKRVYLVVWSFGLSGLFGLSGHLVCLVNENRQEAIGKGQWEKMVYLVYLVIWSIKTGKGQWEKLVYLVYSVKERKARKAGSLICLIYSVCWAIRFIGKGRWICRKPILPHA